MPEEEWELPTGEYRTEPTPKELRRIEVGIGIKIKREAEMAKEYWFCIIGPADKEGLPLGADASVRLAVEKAFQELTGIEDYHCWSGWGLNEKGKDVVLTAHSKAVSG